MDESRIVLIQTKIDIGFVDLSKQIKLIINNKSRVKDTSNIRGQYTAIVILDEESSTLLKREPTNKRINNLLEQALNNYIEEVR